eukprot:TRINITY_DN20329_c0_g1_i1.p1 TRINITY_DN20329_c0_g1~~TRINITY_DN20329_c0_g1_i1.p1  ORF type:complete len:409 (-),score=-7.16 TRINITY_DN20329_c0_g1_i1:315-1541(-)
MITWDTIWWSVFLTLIIPPSNTISIPGSACKDGIFFQKNTQQRSFSWYFLSNTRLSSITINCLWLEPTDWYFELWNSESETPTSLFNYHSLPLTLNAGKPAKWWMLVSTDNPNPTIPLTQLTFSLSLSNHSPCTTNCSNNGVCAVTQDGTHPHCRCFQDEARGFWNTTGEGLPCSECGYPYHTKACNRLVSCNLQTGNCQRGTCYGKKGSGKCTSCVANNGFYYGPHCNDQVICSETTGLCASGQCSGPTGNGKCTKCNPYTYGTYCYSEVSCNYKTANTTCEEGTCWGTNATGNCDSCGQEWYGADCSNKVSCKVPNLRIPPGFRGGGICNAGSCYGITGNGLCDECELYYFDRRCTKRTLCNLKQGICEVSNRHGKIGCSGTYGNGECTRCYPGWSGAYCNTPAKE